MTNGHIIFRMVIAPKRNGHICFRMVIALTRNGHICFRMVIVLTRNGLKKRKDSFISDPEQLFFHKIHLHIPEIQNYFLTG